MKVHTPLFTFALATLVGTAIAQVPTQQPATRGEAQEAKVSHLLLPADKLIGMTANNAADDKLGSLKDLLADPHTGELRYAILDVGGFLGMGSTQRIVPWSVFQVTADKDDANEWHLRAQLTKDQISAAPECKDDDWFDSELDRRMESAFGRQEGLAARGEGKGAFARLSKMDDDVMVRDASGREIGEIETLILAPEHNTIAFAVIDAKDDAGGKRVAVPASSLHFAYAKEDGDARRQGDGRSQGDTGNQGRRNEGGARSDKDKGDLHATTTVPFAKFAGAPEYKKDNLQRMSSTAWLTELNTYYGSEPFWKSTTSASAPAPKSRPTQQ